MTTVVLQHDVQDFATWKAGFVAHRDARKGAGITRETVGQLAGSPNTVVAVFEVADRAAFDAFRTAPGLAETMKASGVTSAPTYTFIDNPESATL